MNESLWGTAIDRLHVKENIKNIQTAVQETEY